MGQPSLVPDDCIHLTSLARWLVVVAQFCPYVLVLVWLVWVKPHTGLFRLRSKKQTRGERKPNREKRNPTLTKKIRLPIPPHNTKRGKGHHTIPYYSMRLLRQAWCVCERACMYVVI